MRRKYTVVFGHSLAALHALRKQAEAFAAEALDLHASKWSAGPVTQDVNFLGHRIWPTHTLRRRQSVVRAKRKIKWFVASWCGHAQWANSHNLVIHPEKRIPHEYQHAR